MRQFQTIQCGNGDTEPTEVCDDGNTSPGDGCLADCRGTDFRLFGVAEGGDVQVTVNGVVVTTMTTAGMSAAAVAAAIAADIAADPTLAGQGVTASALGRLVTTSGVISLTVINDPGLSTEPPPVALPATSPVGSWLLLGALVLSAVGVARRSRPHR
jgi:cysteine-rich repeat protein